MYKVSVIVPIYKVEKFIERCLRSLMEQTLNSIEYIFVNDNTPDKSMDILEKVIKEYPNRINSIIIKNNKENKGSSAARNCGLNLSTGEFIIYCDSDDWVEKDMYEKMYNTAKETNADIVTCNYIYEYATRSDIHKQEYTDDKIDCIKRIFKGELHAGTWNKLIKRNLYVENGIFFPENINMWEDVLTLIPLIYKSNKIVYINDNLYHYVQYNSGAMTKSLKHETLIDLIDAIRIIDIFIKKNNLIDLYNDFNYLKLTVKINLLLNSNGKQQRIWNKLYPETNRYILNHKMMSIYWRIALLFSSCKCLFIFNCFSYLSRLLKK